MDLFSGYVPIFRARLDGYAPPIRLDEIDFHEKRTSSLPTFQVYIRQLKPGDLKSLLTTAKSLIKQIPECVITGNEITGNNTIVVALAKSVTSTKELQWLLRIYDGSGKKVDNLDAMSIKKYLEGLKKDPLTKVEFVSQPAIFTNINELLAVLNLKSIVPEETYCGVKRGFLL